MNIKVAVIGSGLSSLGAIKGLNELGIIPIVFDKGEILSKSKKNFISKLSSVEPKFWTKEQIDELTYNPLIRSKKNSIPKKLLFGSDYPYGRNLKHAPIKSIGSAPPFSYAKGGFSILWGASSLPPAKEDVLDWPFSHSTILKYYKKVLQDIPYTAKNDALSLNFKILKDKFTSLNLNKTEKYIFEKMSASKMTKKDFFLFGHARILVDSTNGKNGCRYCGNCMSGCVYDSIYSAEREFEKLILQKKILYKQNIIVSKVFEKNGKVSVEYIRSGKSFIKKFDKVFIAAGAVNTTRIIMNSIINDKSLDLKTRGGFLMPIFSFREIEHNLPNLNTQPKIFFELKNPIDNHWIHIQLSVSNELFLKHIDDSSNLIYKFFGNFLKKHIMFAFVNLHSSNSSVYKMRVYKNKNFLLETKWINFFPNIKTLFFIFFKLICICKNFMSFPLIPFMKFNNGTYHVGSTFPMKKNPTKFNETDNLGRLLNTKDIHLVDTSIFPSLPGTTIGLLSMANAYRIVRTIKWHLYD